MSVGANTPRRDGFDKVTGRARYVDDLTGEGMLHGRTVRSQVPKGRLERIEFEKGLPWDEIVVVTAADVPGTNRVKLIDLEQPFLVEDEIRHREEPVVLLAHEDREVLARAARGVRLVITPEDPVLSID
jgi:CO/xanthine dehydrogenase Mo-binding subunit